MITDDVIAAIEEASSLAPLHNPVNLAGIREAMRLFPHVPHVAVFDTGFHSTLPPYAYMYGLPYEFYKEKKIRRYGFHGTSHLYVSLKAAEFLKRPFSGLDMVSATWETARRCAPWTTAEAWIPLWASRPRRVY